MVDSGGLGSLTVEELTATGIYYLDTNGVELNSVLPGSGKVVAVEALNGGNILGGVSTGNDISLDGELLLLADGSIGTQAAPIRLSAGKISAGAGNDASDEIHIVTDSDLLTVADITLRDHLNNTRRAGEGAVSYTHLTLPTIYSV